MNTFDHPYGDGAAEICQLAGYLALQKKMFGAKIALDTALHDINMQKRIRKAVDAVHDHKISQQATLGYYTRVRFTPPGSEKSQRKIICAPTEEELYMKLVDFYGLKKAHNENITVDELYHEWQTYRTDIGTAANTSKRDDQRYCKYFKGSKLFEKYVGNLKRSDWKVFCSQVILGNTRNKADAAGLSAEERKLTRKEWGSTRCILNGMLDYAVDQEYISANPLIGMKFEKNLFRQAVHKTRSSEIFNDEEQTLLVSWCERKFEETGDVIYLLPPFNLLLGARIGECVALTWDSVLDGRHIYIYKSEYKNRNNNAICVENHTKTHNNRIVPINAEAAAILERIRETGQSSEWVFARNGERITSRQVAYVLSRFAKENGTSVKSSHKLRKTYGSNLYKAGLNAKQVSDILGNTPDVFEKYYLYDTDTDDKVSSIVDRLSLRYGS